VTQSSEPRSPSLLNWAPESSIRSSTVFSDLSRSSPRSRAQSSCHEVWTCLPSTPRNFGHSCRKRSKWVTSCPRATSSGVSTKTACSATTRSCCHPSARAASPTSPTRATTTSSTRSCSCSSTARSNPIV
jgi:hypothetical protein